MKKVLVILFAVLLICSFAGTSMAVPTTAFNGHEYELILGKINWNAANSAALAEDPAGSWYLAVITSQAEQAWIVTNLINQAATFGTDGINNHLWIGGYQDIAADDFSEPAGGWRWVTGETFGGYTNWLAGQPANTVLEQNYLQIGEEWGWQWDDAIVTDGEAQQSGFIKERVAAVPEPTTMLLLGLGLVGLAGVGRKFKK